ncbi:MAG: hypothetical protein NWP80_00980, partial [Candidatus Gracilibacteria bacterium]|nr:hypothetical protein [Candidatus Gracilibacteria bacterium]
MAKKRKKTTKKSKINYNEIIKNLLTAIGFIIIGIISLFSDTNSLVGKYSDMILIFLFGENYKYIFSPIITLMGILFLFKDSFGVNKARIFGLIIYLITVISLLGFYKSYNSIFNFSYILTNFFGNKVGIIFMSLLFLFSLYLIFKIDYKKIIKKAVSYRPNIANITKSIIDSTITVDENIAKNNKIILDKAITKKHDLLENNLDNQLKIDEIKNIKISKIPP